MVAQRYTCLRTPQESRISVEDDWEQPRAIGSLLAEVLANYGLVREAEGQQPDWTGDEERVFRHQVAEATMLGSAGASPSLTG